MAIEKNKPNTLKHDKKPFTTILNETILLIRDPAALGFYTLLASKPEGWEIVEQFLMNHFGVGRDFCRKKMKYLKQVGVLEVLAIRGGRGRITGWVTVLRVQITENQSSGEETAALGYDQITENPTSGESTRLLKIQNVVAPDSGGSAHINKRYIQIKEDLEKKDIIPTVYEETYFPIPQGKSYSLNAQDVLKQNPHNIPKDMIDDWLINRKAKRSPLTKTAWEQLNNQLSLCQNPIEAFQEMVARGWISIKAEWVNKKHGAPTESYFDNESIEWGKNINKDIF